MQKSKPSLTRREALKCSAAGAALAMTTTVGCEGSATGRAPYKNPGSKAFYGADGAFSAEKAKAALA